ncbi:MAG: hypothetical protein COB67_00055 [SAR324 cluster bacterium]|uniref:Uncharacterized protein n=1 Tax=SAR324 cluster bacterium TaxID=2024889 RepID=A0A2A4TBZ7_9DELT|nr:MAG: hypothetical protein COB67_00055 [SAR324 cluster bacterium]
MCKLNDFNNLKERVLPHLQTYKDDLLINDQMVLKDYTGDFISSYRSSGTHLFLMNLTSTCNWSSDNLENNIQKYKDLAFDFLSLDTNYLFCTSDGEIREITLDEAKAFLENKYQEVDKTRIRMESMNLLSLANEIVFYMHDKGRTWKSKLSSEWSDSYKPSLLKLRNHFD